MNLLFNRVATLFFTTVSLSVSAQTWQQVQNNASLKLGTAYTGIFYNNEFYMGGNFNDAYFKWMAKFNTGTGTWNNLNFAAGNMGGIGVYALATYQGQLYAGGSFLTRVSDTNCRSILRWDGNNWSPVSFGLMDASGTDEGEVAALEVYNGELYAGGSFSYADWGPAQNIAKWNGTAWSAVVAAPWVYCMKSYQGKLFLGTESGVSVWDGTTMSSLGTADNPVKSMEVFNNDLYVGGCFDSIGGIVAHHIAKWDGTSWSAVQSGVTNSVYGVTALRNFRGSLYVGGEFSMAGGYPAGNIARWDGTSWSTVGSGTDGFVYDMVVGPTDLYVLGAFDTAGGIASRPVARLAPCTSVPQAPGAISGPVIAAIGTPTTYSVQQDPTEVYTFTWTLPPGWTGSSSGSIIDVIPGTDPGQIIVYATNSCGMSQTSVLSVSSAPLTVQALGTRKNIHLYPNPSNGRFTVAGELGMGSEMVLYELKDVTGRTVVNGTMPSEKGSFRQQLHAEHLPHGFYIIKLSAGGLSASTPVQIN